jgi:glycosyltransferase involved in cell wall biosynthesis
MKILHIVSSINPKDGGISRAVDILAKGLSEFNYVNEILTLDDINSKYISDNLSNNIHAIGPTKTVWGFTPLLKPWLNSNLCIFDILIIHGLWQYHSYATYKAWKNINGLKPRFFVMPHGMLDPYFQKAKGRQFKAIRNWFFWKLIENKIVNNADHLLFTCLTEKVLAKETFKPYKPKSEIVIGLGSDAPPEFNNRMTIAFNAKIGNSITGYWLFISRIHEKKGVDLLIKAYLALAKEVVNLPALIIAGPGLETIFGKQILELASLNNNIYFPGMLTGDAKWGAFYNSEIFILPSHQENFGIAIVEAMACKIPVLITNKVNIWREIENGKGGIICEDNLTSVLASLKQWVNLNVTQKKTMGENAFDTFYAHFTAKATSKKFVEILQKTV